MGYSVSPGCSNYCGLVLIYTFHIFIISTDTQIDSYKYGIGRHTWDVPVPLLHKAAQVSLNNFPVARRTLIRYKLFWISQVLFLWGTTCTKVSVLLFYRRLIAGTISNKLRWAIWSGIGFVIVYSTALFIYFCKVCTPIEAAWMSWDPTYQKPYRCILPVAMHPVAVTAGACSVIQDVYSIVLPFMLVLKVRMTPRERFGVLIIFGISSL